VGDGTRIEVEGAAALSASLDAAGRDLADLDRAAAGASRIIATAARVLAPKRTGALSRSIEPAPERGTAAVLASERYAPFVHYGTRYMVARPFLVDARRDTKPLWLPLYEQESQQILNHVKGA
jgi:HK97 gp10 family phage protein